MDNVFLKNV